MKDTSEEKIKKIAEELAEDAIASLSIEDCSEEYYQQLVKDFAFNIRSCKHCRKLFKVDE